MIEDADRLGGKVLTRHIGALAVDTGPDTLPVRPLLMALLEELGLTDAAVPAAPVGAYVWSQGKLRRLPAPTAAGVPDRLVPLVRSRLLSASGTLRAGFDLVLPRQALPADATIAELLRSRFGPQLFERLVEPLLGGMYAGRADVLSARSTVPDVDALVRANRSVYLALRKRRRGAVASNVVRHHGPTTITLDRGLGRLVAALADNLAASRPKADIRRRTRVSAVHDTAAGYRLELTHGAATSTLDADAVVLATPAFVAAELLEEMAPTAAAQLRAIPYVDVATVTLTYPAHEVSRPLDGTGFLVPPAEGRLLVGCSWLSAKWSYPANGTVVLRAMVGRPDDVQWSALDDQALVARVRSELAEAMKLSAVPLHVHVQRWPRALPQYTVGHQGRLDRLDAALSERRGLHLTGAAYRGAGVVGCITQAHQCAAKVLAEMSTAAVPARAARI